MTEKKYDWIIVGGGISGISIAEILCREGKSVLLIEKNSEIASETSKVFHEWLHSGTLYSLLPDKLTTLRYLLGATDDLIEYYGSFKRMNIQPTESGLNVVSKNGWFNHENIEYRYKIRKFNPLWMSVVSRSINIIELINQHDWLRRRAGSEYSSSEIKTKYAFNYLKKQFLSNKDFYSVKSPDLTMNSRKLISDLVSFACSNGLKVVTSEAVKKITNINDGVSIETEGGTIYQSERTVICSPDLFSKLFSTPIKTGFAPIAVVENVPENENSFVELDFNTKNCINLLKKNDGIAQAGGITVSSKKEVKPYLDFIIKEHKKRNPGIKVIDSYVGLKKELIQKKETRNYLYHINQQSSNIWSVVLGKFTLAFSMAPEFYRRVYNSNPTKLVNEDLKSFEHNIISKTSWQEIIDKKGT